MSYSIAKLLKIHPVFNCISDISNICSPLNLFNIHYFAHVNIDADKQFSAISNNPKFAEFYLQNHCYNTDIHMTETNFGDMVMWDFMKLSGKSQQMHSIASQFGIKHTFTIIEKNSEGSSDFYHFATKIESTSINQTYIANINLLKTFILYFKEKVKESKFLSQTYNLKILPTNNLSKFSFEKALTNSTIKREFLNKLTLEKPLKKIIKLSPKQTECVFYLAKGMTNKEISKMLNLSPRTVEDHLLIAKQKLDCHSRSALVEKAFNLDDIRNRLFILNKKHEKHEKSI